MIFNGAELSVSEVRNRIKNESLQMVVCVFGLNPTVANDMLNKSPSYNDAMRYTEKCLSGRDMGLILSSIACDIKVLCR